MATRVARRAGRWPGAGECGRRPGQNPGAEGLRRTEEQFWLVHVQGEPALQVDAGDDGQSAGSGRGLPLVPVRRWRWAVASGRLRA